MVIGTEQFFVRFDVVGIVEDDAAAFQRRDVVGVAMVVEAEEDIRIVARAEHFPGPDAHLEDGWPAGDCGRDRHEGHHLLFAAAGEAGEETADRLDAVLRIAGDADDGFGDLGDAGGGRELGSGRQWDHSWQMGRIGRHWKSLGDSTLGALNWVVGTLTVKSHSSSRSLDCAGSTAGRLVSGLPRQALLFMLRPMKTVLFLKHADCPAKPGPLKG